MGVILEQLRETRELLSVPERWTQDQNAKTAAGEYCFTSSPDATCFCLFGGLLKVAGSGLAVIGADHFLEECYEEYPLRGPDEDDHYICFNDRSTHAEVISFLDFSIDRAKKTGL